MSLRREVVPAARALGAGQRRSVGDDRWCGEATFSSCPASPRSIRTPEQPLRGTTASETRQILTNLAQLLEAAGSSLDKVVKVNVLLHSMLEAQNMNEVYARFFPDPPPARTVCGARLPDGVKVIIECTALA